MNKIYKIVLLRVLMAEICNKCFKPIVGIDKWNTYIIASDKFGLDEVTHADCKNAVQIESKA